MTSVKLQTPKLDDFIILPHKLPTVSLVIPSHNRRQPLSNVLEHIRKLNYPTDLLELVIVLDGCTDGSEEMLKGVQKDFPFKLCIISQAQGGPSSARNTGVQMAHNEYILFLDDDVMPTPDLVLQHWRLHREFPDTVSVGTMSKPPKTKKPIWVRWEEYTLQRQYQDLLDKKYEFSPRQFYTGNCSLKRKWILTAGLFDESFKRYEDVVLAFELAKQGLNFKFNPEAVGYHYPSRSFKSWLKMYYLYGKYAVEIDRRKHLVEMVKICQDEFHSRHVVTRILSKNLLNHRGLQKIVSIFLVGVAQLGSLIGLERVSYRVLSCVANFLFWQGFNEQLHLSDFNAG